ncbi:methyltransferase domain-containing protein [Paenibacillus sp. OV219]|uniref:methyltransferase domain-containing protein n=1 Tax=Paenibacillus sp. OV219 TaxID=1884377 RepID=UPI0008D73CA6|nr:methyltransferase domain-containing protein [Paenibacillus sp. OV219]SEO15957.1 Methyltransferase domain-containing protein [Paenibacillus sp. OV219]
MENVILFGASKYGLSVLYYVQSRYNVLYFCDNDSRKWGERIEDIEVISPDQLAGLNYSKIIIASTFYKEIAVQLHNMSIYNFERIEINTYKDTNNDLGMYKKLFGEEATENRRFYNIGAGQFRHSAWQNVDYASDWYAMNQVDIQWNLLENTPLPVESNSASVVYTSHTVEHIPNISAQNMFNEAYRILKEGGTFRVTTPNIDLAYNAFKKNDRYFYKLIDTYSTKEQMERVNIIKPMNEASIHQVFLFHFAGQTSSLHADPNTVKISDEELEHTFKTLPYDQALDYCVSKCSLEIQNKYPGNHINWWNQTKLFQSLKEAGFKNVYLSAYSQSASPVLRNTDLFDNTHPENSIYVEAIK